MAARGLLVFALVSAHVAAVHSGFGCAPADLGNRTCFSNKDNVIKSYTVHSAAECCGFCSSNDACKSWTFWGGNKCHIFKTTVKGQRGEACVSGIGKPMPPAPSPKPPKSPWVPPPPPGPACKDCPNIIFSLTDDQDVQLGGWEPMVQTRKLLQEDANGAYLTNWRIHTPICSPSRSETVSGRYFHNIKSDLNVPPAKLQGAATGHINGSLYDNDSFGVHLRAKKGYNVGMFGKSNFNTLQGFDRWFQGVNCGYGGRAQDNESPTFHTKVDRSQYFTDVIANKAIEWMKRDNVSGASAGGRPFFVYFAPHCPHTPAHPADKYANACPNVTSPRIPNYNYTNDGFHELVARQPPLSRADEILIDDLARRRCQTLLSVDDANAALVAAVKEIGAWDKTYFVVSSDHGYSEWGLALGCSECAEQGLRVW